MNFPNPEFLLDDADKTLVETYLSSDAAVPPAMRQQIEGLSEHLLNVLESEMLAAAQALKLPRQEQSLYFKRSQTLALLAPPRRVCLAISDLDLNVHGVGLVQSCYEHLDELHYWIEAVQALAPPALERDLTPWLLGIRDCFIECQERGMVSDETRSRFKDDDTLEGRVRDIDWQRQIFTHILGHSQCFFLQPGQGDSRYPLTDYFAIEAKLYEAECERREQARLRKVAADDAKISDLRCPACGQPMPGYRQSCKFCKAVRGRVQP